ncbi:MAG: homocysteine S-methyltransferase family protein [Actinomycetota bacterium]
MVDFHVPRLEALAAAEPDVLACETIPSIAEAGRSCARSSTSPASPRG